MPRPSLALAVVLLVACKGSGDGTTPTPDDSGTAPTTEPTVDTSYDFSDEGSLMLVRRQQPNGTSRVLLYGLFVDEHAGYRNLARCAITGSWCFDYVPLDEDDYLDIDTERFFEPGFSEFRFVGYDVALGEWEASYVNGEVPHYFADLTEEIGLERIRGKYGVRFAGQWGEYVGTADIDIAPDIELISPRAGGNINFHDGEIITIEWVPEGNGDVFLTLMETGNNATLARMYLLEDDGYFELPVADLGFGTNEEHLDFTLSRWNWGKAEKWGNELDVVATSEVGWSGDYFYTGGRDELEISDGCLAATTMPLLEPGSYWGELGSAGLKDDMWDTDDCTNGQDANAPEGFLRVQIEPNDFLSATYTLLEDDASIYLVSDCTNVNTCLEGADENGDGDPESVGYFNNTDETVELYLALDGDSSSIGLYNLDVSIDTLLEPDMYNTCPEAVANAAPLADASYFTSYLPYTNSIDPGTGGCTGTTLLGPDSFSLVTLQAGETLTANVNMPGGDPALYLLYSCADAFSCAGGKDISVGDKETLVYVNNSGVSENLWLVLDTKGQGLRPYFLTIDIQ